MGIKKFEQFKINEGINTEELSEEQRAALKEVQESDLSVLDDRDMQHYADKVGVPLEDLAGYLADSGMPNTTEEVEEVEEMDSELEELVQRELVDNEEVDSGNLPYKIQELVDRLENGDYYEWDLEEEWDDYLGKYETLADTIKAMYNELTGVNNPNQMSMEFESIKRFSDFTNESHGELRKSGLFYNHILDGEDATEENAYAHARGLDWMEIESSEESYPYLTYIDTVNGVGIYHNFGHDAYYFTDETGEVLDENYINENSQWSEKEWSEFERKHTIAKESIKDNVHEICRKMYDSFNLYYANNHETVIYKNVGTLNAPKTEIDTISGGTIVGINSQNGSLGILYKLVLFNLNGEKIGDMSTWKFPYLNNEDDFTKLARIKKSFGKFEDLEIY